MKTSELIGIPLDWAVERAKGTFWSANGYFCYSPQEVKYPFSSKPLHRYSIEWEWGGPIIEQERIEISYGKNSDLWFASASDVFMFMPGETLLIAAMRCFCFSKLGEEVELPEGLT